LIELGMSRSVARLIAYLANVREASSKEIETGTDLRQPEVSIGMRTLRDNHWVTEREVKALNKGRPMKFYSLNVSLHDIIGHFEEETLKESSRAMESFKKLREIALA
jgi:predicted transcriptional regulator